MNRTLIAAFVLAIALPLTAHGAPPVYNYLDVGYAKASVSGLSGGAGYTLDGSYSINDQFFVAGRYGHNSFDDTGFGGVFTHGYILGGGFRTPVYRGKFPLDLVVRASLASDNVKELGASDTKNGYDAGLGLRFMMVPGIELYGFTDYDNVGLVSHYHAGGEVVTSAGVNYTLTNHVALGFSYVTSNRYSGKLLELKAEWQF